MKKKFYWFLCTQLGCSYFWSEFKVYATKKPIGYVPCPACKCSAEYNGLGGDRLVDRVKVNA